jgi:hypothetical protein
MLINIEIQVKILLHASVKLRQIFKQETGIDILQSKTIAGACMKEYRQNHLPDSNYLPLITEKGYGVDKNFKQSSIARKYLLWYNHVNNVTLRTSDSANYEKSIAGYYVDGFLEAQDRPFGQQNRDLIIEVHGCYW